MDFSLDKETDLLQKSAREYLKKECPASVVKEIIAGEEGFSRTIWKKMGELGWLELIYDEKYGGVGGTFFDLFVLFKEMGKALLPSPFFCSPVVSGFLLLAGGREEQKEKYLPALINGEKIYTTALFDENGRTNVNDPGLRVEETGTGDYIINGTRLLVPFAHMADTIITPGTIDGSDEKGSTLFMVDRLSEGISLVPLDVLTREKTFSVIFENVRVPSEMVIGSPHKGGAYLKDILHEITILKCGEMLGGLEQVVEMTVTHVKERHQFGRPLGVFQIIHHHCADMAMYLETARLISSQAAYLISEGIACEKEVSMAKAWCGDVYKKSTWISHQLHGGIGFTEEHDLHLYYKHAKVSELTFEDAWFHRDRVAESMGL